MAESWWSPLVLTSAEAWALVQRGLGLVVFLQALEQWSSRRALDDDGIWAWPLLKGHGGRRRTSVGPHGRSTHEIVMRGIIVARMMSGALMLALRDVGVAVSFVAFGTSLLMSMRFRGRENGAADAMTNLVALSVFAVDGASTFNIEATRTGLVFVASQSVLSYFSAGMIKLRRPLWRSGRALRTFVGIERYGAPTWTSHLLAVPGVAIVASLCLIVWQMTFPLSVLVPSWCILACLIGLVFHVINFFVFGLQRFMWAWAITYPAVWFVSTFVAG